MNNKSHAILTQLLHNTYPVGTRVRDKYFDILGTVVKTNKPSNGVLIAYDIQPQNPNQFYVHITIETQNNFEIISKE